MASLANCLRLGQSGQPDCARFDPFSPSSHVAPTSAGRAPNNQAWQDLQGNRPRMDSLPNDVDGDAPEDEDLRVLPKRQHRR